MFSDCTSLKYGPSKLPMLKLYSFCYSSMFKGCINLEIAPEILATEMRTSYGDDSHCRDMFYGCTSLKNAPDLNATKIGDYCYYGMFENCINLEYAPSILPAETTYSYCYCRMFRGCSKLSSSPELPSQTLSDHCYYSMFSGCSNLNYIKCLAIDKSASYCTYQWVLNVPKAGLFIKNSSST